MHIALDFLPELFAQPILSDVSKQLFAVDLISYLSLQYTLPKAFNVARLAINSLSTLLNGNYLFLNNCFIVNFMQWTNIDIIT